MNRFAPAETVVPIRQRLPGLLGRGLVYATVVSAVTLRGSTAGLPRALYCVLAAVTFAVAALQSFPVRTSRALKGALALAALLAAWLALQSLSFAGNPFANPIWEATGPLLGSAEGSVSVAPGLTREAILPLVAPILLYAAALIVFASEKDAIRLWRFLGGLGVVFAVAGAVQLVAFPTTFFFVQPKTAYVDSLTGFLVNRNSAGTLLAAASLVLFALLLVELRGASPDNRWSAILEPSSLRSGKRRLVAVLAGSWLVVLVALLMTRSRGAVVAAVLCYACVAPLALAERTSRSATADERATGRRRLVRLVAGVGAALAVVVAVFGGQLILRQQVRGLDIERLCTYRATWRAFADNWLFGTGFGTFPLVFPSYRDPDCATIHNVWLRAHNVWLEAMLGLGVAVVPVVLATSGYLLAVFWRGYRRRQRLRSVPAIAIGLVMLVFLHGMVDFSLQIPGVAAYVAVALASATTVSLRRS